MQILRTGIILNVEKFDECVGFYRDLFDLEVLFEERSGAFKLACLEFGGAYLMIETDGFAKPEGKSLQEGASKLRFNVADIDRALESIRAQGIEAEIIRNDWGSTINLFDPDGNRVGIRDEETFKLQIGA
ncbi:MAG TPA: VOC family protein [Gammaproteobacteria bacterium]|nr:VOC family protein [Gammaproteobacteria bacterium]